MYETPMVPPKDIIVPKTRIRTEFGDLDALATSIKKVGIINPIVVRDGDPSIGEDSSALYLVAGERRLRASILAGMRKVPVLRRQELDEQLLLELELEENLGRKDLEWYEEVEAKLRIFEIQQEREGVAKRGRGNTGGFGVRDLAILLNESTGSIHGDLQLARALRMDETLIGAKNKTEAIKRLKKVFDTSTVEIFNKLTEDATQEPIDGEAQKPTSPNIIIAKYQEKIQNFVDSYNVGDAYAGLATYTNTFNLIHMDPPYAIDYKDKRRGDSELADDYVEIPEDQYVKKMTELAKYSYLAATEHAYAILWHAFTNTGVLIDIFTQHGWRVNPVPLTWVKPDRGQCRNPAQWFSNNTEPALMMVKGRPVLAQQGQPNYFIHKTVGERIHPTEKPVALMIDIFTRICLHGQHICSPFLGSGNDIIAANFLKCSCVGWDLSNEYRTAAIARMLKYKPKIEDI